MSVMLIPFDTETTGFENNHLIEIAASVRLPKGGICNYWERCKPQTPIEPSAAEVHGITNEEVENCRPDTVVATQFWDQMRYLATNHQATTVILAGHNTGFDIRVMRKYVPISESPLTICSMRLGRLFDPSAPDHKLTTLYEYLQLPGEFKAHSAMDDVLMSVNIIDHYCERHNRTYLELAEMLKDPILLEVMPFGKHKGTLISLLPTSYINYMLGFSDLDVDAAYSMRVELAKRSKK